MPEHFVCLNLITQLQKLKKLEGFEDFAKKVTFSFNYRNLSLDFRHELQIWTHLVDPHLALDLGLHVRAGVSRVSETI